jgi:hypothetical protein
MPLSKNTVADAGGLSSISFLCLQIFVKPCDNKSWLPANALLNKGKLRFPKIPKGHAHLMKKITKKIHNAILRIQSSIKNVWHQLLRYRLKKLYNKRTAISSNKNTVLETVDPEIIQLGQKLRQSTLEEYQSKYKDSSYRILFQIPPNGVGIVWFQDLMRALNYVGIPCASVQWADPNFRQTWDSFRPNVFMSIDIAGVIKDNDLDFINQYKKKEGCLRLFTPSNKTHFPKPGLSEEDKWRLDLARSGKLVDAYFCMFVKEHYDEFFPEWREAGFEYLSLPNGCNPIYQFPQDGKREFDYFLATSYGPDRIIMTWRYIKPIFERYNGLWAGPGWGFGIGPIKSDELPALYARAKIVPNPLHPFLTQHPHEISERAFSATACGAFQITDWTPVTEKFFASDELISARGAQEFLEKFEYYVQRPDERNAIIKKGVQRVFTQHTYFHRIASLVEFLDQHPDLFFNPKVSK